MVIEKTYHLGYLDGPDRPFTYYFVGIHRPSGIAHPASPSRNGVECVTTTRLMEPLDMLKGYMMAVHSEFSFEEGFRLDYRNWSPQATEMFGDTLDLIGMKEHIRPLEQKEILFLEQIVGLRIK